MRFTIPTVFCVCCKRTPDTHGVKQWIQCELFMPFDTASQFPDNEASDHVSFCSYRCARRFFGFRAHNTTDPLPRWDATA